MARIKWVQCYLDNWALWKEREASGSQGYPTSSSFLREVSSGYREAIIPVSDCDASVTNDAVESLKGTRPFLYQALQCIYIKRLGVKGTAREMGRAESTVKGLLDSADHALSAWFSDRASQKQRSFPP